MDTSIKAIKLKDEAKEHHSGYWVTHKQPNVKVTKDNKGIHVEVDEDFEGELNVYLEKNKAPYTEYKDPKQPKCPNLSDVYSPTTKPTYTHCNIVGNYTVRLPESIADNSNLNGYCMDFKPTLR